MNFFKRLIEQAQSYRSPTIAYMDDEESSDVMHVYKITNHPDLTIFYNMMENHATLIVDTDPEHEYTSDEDENPREDGYLSSERFEDWRALEIRFPYWTVTLRQIETMYRHDIQDMIHAYQEEE